MNEKLSKYNDFLRKQSKAKNCLLADLNADMQQEIEKYKQAGFLKGDNILAVPQTRLGLWLAMLNDFGPLSKSSADSGIHPANAFIGYYLRLELLSCHGLSLRLVDEIKAYFLRMAETTGTLWEYNSPVASYNHGFASHVAHCLFRDVLGAYEIDYAGRNLKLCLQEMTLEWCDELIPTPEGPIEISWWKENGALKHNVSTPSGFSIQFVWKILEKPVFKEKHDSNKQVLLAHLSKGIDYESL